MTAEHVGCVPPFHSIRCSAGRRPLRAVVRSALRSGRGGILGPNTDRRARWYDLQLDCGHRVQRDVRYVPTGEGWARHRGAHEVLPPPRQARCEHCPTAAIIKQKAPEER